MERRTLFAIIAGSLIPMVSFGTEYQLTDLGVDGAESSFAVALNNRQMVAGYSNYPGSSLHPWIWSPRTGHRSLGFTGEVIAVNQRGWVAGTRGLLPEPEPFVLDHNGIQFLTLPNNSFGYSTAMNDAGAVVGVMTQAFTAMGGFLWRNGKSITLNDNGMFFPSGISNNNTIVGTVLNVGVFRAAKWVEGKVTIIDPFGAGPSEAIGVNSGGMIVGNMSVGTGQTRSAFVWTDKGGLKNITPTSSFATCISVNDRGQAVGTMDGRAFFWESGKLKMLDDLVINAKGWRFERAAGINNRGQIVGTAVVNQLLRGFLLTPKHQ